MSTPPDGTSPMASDEVNDKEVNDKQVPYGPSLRSINLSILDRGVPFLVGIVQCMDSNTTVEGTLSL